VIQGCSGEHREEVRQEKTPVALPPSAPRTRSQGTGQTPAVTGKGLSRVRNLFPVPRAGWGLMFRGTG
jgi:hypothetical protein